MLVLQIIETNVRVEMLWLSDVTQPLINYVRFNLVCIFIDYSVDNSWFWIKIYVQFAVKFGILLAF